MSKNNRELIRSTETQDDLLSIWIFGAREWSPDQADKHLHDIGLFCDRLRDDPQLGRTRNDLIQGLYSFLIRPHIVYYRVSPTTITIVRVLHQRFDATTQFK